MAHGVSGRSVVGLEKVGSKMHPLCALALGFSSPKHSGACSAHYLAEIDALPPWTCGRKERGEEAREQGSLGFRRTALWMDSYRNI